MPQLDLTTYQEQIWITLIMFSFLYSLIRFIILPHIQYNLKMLYKLEEKYIYNKKQKTNIQSEFVALLFKRKVIK